MGSGLRVRKRSCSAGILTYAQKALDDSKRQAQVGTVPPIQVVSAQSTVATDQQNLIVAQNNLQLQQLLMKNALSRSIEDPVLAEADVIPTSTVQVPQEEPVIPIQDLINDALRHRAELVESRIDLSSRDINTKAVRNAMLPTLDAFAYYGGSGLGGDLNPQCTFSGSACSPPPVFNGANSMGYGGTLNQLLNSTAPDKGIGLTLTIPIRNRLAQSNQVRAELEYRQALGHADHRQPELVGRRQQLGPHLACVVGCLGHGPELGQRELPDRVAQHLLLVGRGEVEQVAAASLGLPRGTRELLGGGKRAPGSRGRAHRGLRGLVQKPLGLIAQPQAIDDVRGGDLVQPAQADRHAALGEVRLR